jgi:FtsP/CotA-like multicopper oxidase with cupredoxin domain
MAAASGSSSSMASASRTTGPALFRPGERIRLRLINASAMNFFAFFVVENGKGERAPLKHTVIVKPGETITVHTSFDEPGPWVFHCHLFYHAAAGMVQALAQGASA